MKKTDRNAPCPCGSGKKYKQCCLPRDEAIASSKLSRIATEKLHIPQVIEAALEHHQAGRLPQAEELYQQILQVEPKHPDALHFSGMIAHQLGKNDTAVELMEKSIRLNPSAPMYYNNLGSVFMAQGKLDAAIENFHKALALKPGYAEACYNTGVAFQMSGKLDAAVENYRKALALKPDYAQAQSNLGMVLKERESVAAFERYEREFSHKPDLAEAHHNLGIVFEDHRLVVPLQRTIDFAFFPHVPVISLELTNNCNLKCPYCANPTLERPKAYIEWALLEKIIDECAERQYNLAWLHGVGEPLLWKRLEEVVALIKRKGAGDGSFGTNGTLLHPDRVRKLLDAGLESIYVSIDTLDPEIYKNTRGGKLEKVVQNIQEMIKIAPSTFKITVALMDHKDHRITGETIKQFHQVFGHHENVRTNLVENALFPSAPGDYRVDGSSKTRSCFSPINYLFIALDGRAAICCVDQEVLHSLGNVAERSIHDIWFDPRNQTTFRNVALGVFECPEICTKKCVLLPPQQNAKTISPGLGLPFDEAAGFADMLLQNDAKTIAFPIFRDMARRDPTNSILRDILNLK